MTLDDLKLLGQLLREILPPALFGRGPSLDSQLILLRNIQLANTTSKTSAMNSVKEWQASSPRCQLPTGPAGMA